MSMTDPIADMFTRIRNAQASGKRSVSMPSSRVKVSLAELLKTEGYISEFKVNAVENNKHVLEIALKYYDGKRVIERLQRIRFQKPLGPGAALRVALRRSGASVQFEVHLATEPADATSAVTGRLEFARFSGR